MTAQSTWPAAAATAVSQTAANTTVDVGPAGPAAAAALAGVVEAVDSKIIEPHESVLVMITGSGLKDIRSSIRAGGEPLRIKPDLTSVAAAVENAM